MLHCVLLRGYLCRRIDRKCETSRDFHGQRKEADTQAMKQKRHGRSCIRHVIIYKI